MISIYSPSGSWRECAAAAVSADDDDDIVCLGDWEVEKRLEQEMLTRWEGEEASSTRIRQFTFLVKGEVLKGKCSSISRVLAMQANSSQVGSQNSRSSHRRSVAVSYRTAELLLGARRPTKGYRSAILNNGLVEMATDGSTSETSSRKR